MSWASDEGDGSPPFSSRGASDWARRHSAATVSLLQGVHPKAVQEMRGHATISITLDTYSHVLPNMPRDASMALEQVLWR